MAGKKMSKSQIIAHMATKLNIPKKVAAQGMEEFVKLAYREAKNTFTIPGLGKLVLVDRKDLPSAGAGETPIVGIAPAVGNAVFHATGVRLRAMPMQPAFDASSKSVKNTNSLRAG